MFLAHSFRLRDPWQCEALDGGAVRWSRVFHRPTGLEDDDALWLVCAGLPAGAVVTFNGQPVDRPDAAGRNEFDVTTLVADSNRIEIEVPESSPSPVSRPPSPTPFPYDVRLGVVGHS